MMQKSRLPKQTAFSCFLMIKSKIGKNQKNP
jgi:hypothetical protein